MRLSSALPLVRLTSVKRGRGSQTSLFFNAQALEMLGRPDRIDFSPSDSDKILLFEGDEDDCKVSHTKSGGAYVAVKRLMNDNPELFQGTLFKIEVEDGQALMRPIPEEDFVR